MDHSASGQGGWPDPQHHPNEVLRRNFWFGVIDLTSSLVLRHEIGLDRIVIESDYPHADSTWPDTVDPRGRGARRPARPTRPSASAGATPPTCSRSDAVPAGG